MATHLHPLLTTIQTFALQCSNLEQLNSLKLMLQTSTIDLLNLSSKNNDNRTIMTSPATDTIPDGGITLISNDLALNKNNSSLLLPSKMLLVQVDHTFLLQCNNNNSNSNINRGPSAPLNYQLPKEVCSVLSFA